jgi:hypothetical protein
LLIQEAHPPSTRWSNVIPFLSHENRADIDHYQAQARATVDSLLHSRRPVDRSAQSRPVRDAAKHPLSPARQPRKASNHEEPSASTSGSLPRPRPHPLNAHFASLVGWGEGGADSDKGKAREKYDPDEYTHAKKKLKKAVLEHYRGLELLGDYRVSYRLL